jgi:hypothetical protein
MILYNQYLPKIFKIKKLGVEVIISNSINYSVVVAEMIKFYYVYTIDFITCGWATISFQVPS